MENGSPTPRKVMVVADPTRESAGALEYALSHAIVENDLLILFHVENSNNNNAWKNPFNRGFLRKSISSGTNGHNNNNNNNSMATYTSSSSVNLGGKGGDVEFLETMKQVCVSSEPRLKVVVEKARNEEGKDKASVILEHCKVLKIDLIVIGQRRSLSSALLGSKRGVSLKGIDTAENLITNSKCTCVAVQKKGQNAGYILSSKTHRNFWLLA